jgi:CheY-like chemotaxis protein
MIYGVDVLVVDDDQETRETLSMMLEEIGGFTVLTAPDGESALIRLRTHPTPLVVVLDWWMPGMDGIAVLHAMASDASEAQRHVYILLTARREMVRPLLATLPANLPVTLAGKPFDMDDLLGLVRRAATQLQQQRWHDDLAASPFA